MSVSFITRLQSAVIAGVLLVSLSPVVASANAGSHHKHGCGPKQHHGMQTLLDEVGVSAEQKQQIEQIKTDTKAQMKPLRETLSQKRRAFMQYAISPEATEAEALARKQEMSQLRNQASELHLKSMFKIKAVLTPDQQKKLATLLTEKMDAMQKRREEWKQKHAPEKSSNADIDKELTLE